jgi:chemotaxis protein CheX
VKDDLDQILRSSASAVLTTMLNFDVEFGEPGEPFFNGESNIAGAVGLTGSYNGIIYLYSSAQFARTITCSLLSMTDSEIEGDDMVNDAVGELTNMVAGNIKSKLDNCNSPCTMTIPSVVRGADFQIEAVSGVQKHSVNCHCKGGRILVEAMIKPAEESN